MDSKTKSSLEQARLFACSMRMAEAYTILRRFFDRLPFKPEPEHGEYISLFVRVICELGKENELKFYLAELERWDIENSNAAIKYQLAFIYAHLPEPRYETCRKTLEALLRSPDAGEYAVKAKMLLAHYYDYVKDDVGMCRRIIDTIGPVEDTDLALLVDVWRAKILKDEGDLVSAERMLNDVLSRTNQQKNWYPFFCVRVAQVFLYVKWKKHAIARPIVEEIRELFEGRRFKTVLSQIEAMDQLLAKDRKIGTICLHTVERQQTLRYENRSIALSDCPSDKLLVSFLQRRVISKPVIVKTLFERAYDADRDDKLVYYHIHSLRKRLSSIGLPKDSIRTEPEGYRLIPKVEIIEEDL